MAARPNLKIITQPPLWLLGSRLALAGLLLWLGTLPDAAVWRILLHTLGWVLASADIVLRLPSGRQFELLPWLAATLYAFFVGLSGSGLFCAIAFRAAWEAAAILRNRAFQRERKRLDILPESAMVFREGQQKTIPPDKIVPGDAVIIQPGTIVPADALVVKGESLTGLAALTGEMKTLLSGPGSRIYAGMNNETGLLAVKAERTGDDTLARAWQARITEAASAYSKPEKRVRFLSQVAGAVIALAGVILCVLPSIAGWENAPEWRQRAAGVLLAACPLAATAWPAALRVKAVFAAVRTGGRATADTLWSLGHTDMAVFDESGLMTDGHYEVTGLELSPGVDRDTLLRCAAIAQARAKGAQADAVRAYCGDVGCEPDSCEERHGGVIARFSGQVIYAGQPFFLRAHGVTCDDGPQEMLRVALDGQLVGSLRLGGRMREDAEVLPGAVAALRMDTALMTGQSQESASSLSERLHIRDLHAGLSEQDKNRVFEELLAECRGKALLLSVTPSDTAAVSVVPDMWESPDAMRGNRLILPGHSPAPLAVLLKLARTVRRLAAESLLCVVCAKAALIVLTLWNPELLWLAGLGEALLTVLLPVLLHSRKTL